MPLLFCFWNEYITEGDDNYESYAVIFISGSDE